MKHIIMTSGGVGSLVTLSLVLERYSPSSVVSLFADTKMEDEDLYRFLEESHGALGVKLTTIADGRDPWQVFKDVKFIGNSRVDPCSKILKRELIDRWIKANFEPEDCIVYIGIDWSEKHRYERLAPRKLPYVYKAPMVEREMMLSTEDKIKFCRELGVEPPRLYGMGFAHNNCGGFCVKAGLAQFKLLHEQMPDRYQYHVEREREGAA